MLHFPPSGQNKVTVSHKLRYTSSTWYPIESIEFVLSADGRYFKPALFGGGKQGSIGDLNDRQFAKPTHAHANGLYQ